MISYHVLNILKSIIAENFISIGGKKGSLISRIVLMCDELSTLD